VSASYDMGRYLFSKGLQISVSIPLRMPMNFAVLPAAGDEA
jgi:hypothetical protein